MQSMPPATWERCLAAMCHCQRKGWGRIFLLPSCCWSDDLNLSGSRALPADQERDITGTLCAVLREEGHGKGFLFRPLALCCGLGRL